MGNQHRQQLIQYQVIIEYRQREEDCDNTAAITVMMHASGTFCTDFLPLKYARTIDDEYIDLVLTHRVPYDITKGLFCKNSESVPSSSAAFDVPGTPLLLVSNQKWNGKSMAKGVVFVERQVRLDKYLFEEERNKDKLIHIQIQNKTRWPFLLLLCNQRIRFREPIEFPAKTHSNTPRNCLAWLITNKGLKNIVDALPYAVIV